MNKNTKIPNSENPEAFTGLELGKPKETAAGIPAVISSAKHIFSEMGIGRGLKALSSLNQKGGIDCPGCAWPDPDDERSGIAEYCENGAKAIAEEATTKRLDAKFFAENSVYNLSQLDDYRIGKKGRVAQPMYLAKDATHYTQISWEDAFAKIATHLNVLASPNEAVFYTSGRTSNEAAFLYQLFVREYGTNNLPDCSNMCHESSGVALNESVGIGKGSVKLEDFYNTEVVLILGQNPGTNHPRMLSALKKAKENGATIISINPIVETGLLNFANPQEVRGALGIKAKLTDIYLQVKINGDMALLKAIMYLLLQAEKQNPNTVFDNDFIKDNTHNFDAFIANIKRQNFDQLVIASGVPVHQIIQVAEILIAKKRIIACWAMGLTQHKNAVETIQDVVNILLLKGSIGKPGAGTCPVRGHSNVQGDRTMGIYEKPSIAFLNNIQRVFQFTPPQEHGLDVVDSIHAMHQGKAKVFVAMGGNFLSATPDTEYTANALRNCALTVHVSTKLNRSHLITGAEALILPCLARTDIDIINEERQFISVENSMGVVSASKGNLKPISNNLMSEPAIVCHLAKATLGKKSKVDWDSYLQSYDAIRDSIEKTIPGFDAFNIRVRQPEGFYLPNGARINEFKTTTGKANFTVSNLETIALAPNEYLMMTIRSHDQFNTTIYGLDDRYRGILNERRVILMNKQDMQKANLQQQQIVDIYNYHDGVERVAHKFLVIEYNIPERCVATYFPETNVLVPIKSTADKSNTPTSKSVTVKLKAI
ncbi:MAG: FdhF/YdeP family oxidoreductase [Chitinophagaceae bacterium]|nr:FdhF/YdeP family oxidoreductase [Chitinophagaceae bacterium]